MHAYAIQPSAGLVKLDAMENPFRAAARAAARTGRAAGRGGDQPLPGCERGASDRAALSRHVELPAGCKLMLGNGSDELIVAAAMACDVPGATILAPLPGFVMYAMSAQLQGLKFVGVPLTPTSSSTKRRCWPRSSTHRPALTYLAYPNNPTANLFDDAVIERIVAAVGAQHGLVVFDEAYQPFSSRSWMQRMAAHAARAADAHAVASSAWPACASATCAGAAALIAEIDKVRPPYNISVLNAEATLFALEHADEFARQAALLRDERARLQASLRALPGVRACPSDANMILVRVPDRSAPSTA